MLFSMFKFVLSVGFVGEIQFGHGRSDLTFLLRGQRSKSPYGRSKFQNENFFIPKADLESLQKSTNVKCFSFFNIFIGTLSKFT